MSQDEPQPPAAFASLPTTSWTFLDRVCAAEGEERRRLHDDLVTRYRAPLLAFYRTRGASQADAEDLVQGFLLQITTQRGFPPEREKTPRFRSWLLACARNYLVDVARREGAQERKPALPMIYLDAQQSDGRNVQHPAAGDAADEAYRDAWRRDVVERALETVAARAAAKGRGADVQIFKEYYAAGEDEGASWEELARRHGLAGWKQAFNKADSVKEQLRRAIREEILSYAESEEEVDEEIRDLLG